MNISVYKPLLNFSIYAKIDQIASVNVPTQYSTTHYLANSSRQGRIQDFP